MRRILQKVFATTLVLMFCTMPLIVQTNTPSTSFSNVLEVVEFESDGSYNFNWGSVTFTEAPSAFNFYEDWFIDNMVAMPYLFRLGNLPEGMDIWDFIRDREADRAGVFNGVLDNRTNMYDGYYVMRVPEWTEDEVKYILAGTSIELSSGIYMFGGSGGARFIVVGDGISHETTAPPTNNHVLRFVIGQTTFTNNSVAGTLDAAPFIQNGRTMVPLGVIVQALGATNVNFDNATQVVSFTVDGVDFALTIGEALPGGMGTPVLVQSRTFVPLAYISLAIGAQVRWDSTNRAAYVYI